MLEHNIVIMGIPEDKWEDPEPRKGKICNELANLMMGNTQEEKLKKANNNNNMFYSLDFLQCSLRFIFDHIFYYYQENGIPHHTLCVYAVAFG